MIASAAAGEALRRFRRAWRRVIVAEIVFKISAALLATAGSAVMLRWVEARGGRGAVTNHDLVSFLTHPGSVALLLVTTGVAAAFVLLEQAVLLALLRPGGPAHAGFGARARAAGGAVQRVARLAVLCVGVLLLVLAIAAVLAGGIYGALLSGHDINYYLASRPPVFLAAAGLGGAVAAAAAVLLLVVLVRWILAVPITVFEGVRPVGAIAESRRRIRGRGWRVALTLLVWHGGLFALSLAALLGFRPAAYALVDAAGDSIVAVASAVVALLALHGAGVAVMSFLDSVGHALIVLHFYDATHPAGALPAAERVDVEDSGALAIRGRALAGIAAGLFLTGFVLPAAVLVSQRGHQETIDVTAHRGDSKNAPENTASAVRGAIEAGADWAEIDVQETADGHVVVLHDQDLMRLGNDPRRIANLTLEEAKQIDVGAKFDPRFAGERLATLEEMLDLALGKIRLNIELKYYGKGDPRLAKDVARILHLRDPERRCVVASLDYASLGEARREWPALRTAAIVTVRVGDSTRLDVDALSMNAKLVDAAFLKAAHRAGKEVLVWTIDDPKAAIRLMELGVDNLITNRPAPMVRLRDERRGLSRAARLALAFRVALGLSVDFPPAGEAVSDL